MDGIGYTIFFLPGNCFCEVSFSRALSFSFPISSFSKIFFFISCSSSMFFLFLCSLLSDSLSFNLPTLSDALSFPSLISFLYLYVSAIAPPLLKNLQIAEGSNQVLKGLQISMAPAQRSKQLAPIWCCLAQEKGCSASQLQRGL